MPLQPNDETYLTPPQLARLWGVKPEKIIRWIRSGELKAFDFSADPGTGRPRYRIRQSDAESFERLRQAGPPLPTPEPSHSIYETHDWSSELS